MTGTLKRAAILVLAVGAGFAALGSPAGAAVDPSRTVVSPTAKLGDAGRVVRVVGQVRCPACTRLALAVTVSQRSGAVAQGGVRCVCHAASEKWMIRARVRGSVKLHAGRAQVCAWVIARGAAGKPIDAYQWCRKVTLA